jgi:hypothetical protein
VLVKESASKVDPREEVAAAISAARSRVPPVKRFAFLLRTQLGWQSLSRQTIYEWESCRTRVPAEVLIGAARIAGLSVDDLLLLAYPLRSAGGGPLENV